MKGRITSIYLVLLSAGLPAAADTLTQWPYGTDPAPAPAGRGAPAVPPDNTANRIAGGWQLYDLQQGTRKGLWSDLMKPVVAKLSDDDILNLVAYAASSTP